MRMARIKPEGRAVLYHCVSRVVGGEYLLGDAEKEAFRRLMWAQVSFCGVDLVSYCLMSNHVHLLVKVPGKIQLDDRSLFERVSTFYGPKHALTKRLAALRKNDEPIPPDLKDQLLARMGDVSVFNKELKQRFSAWYNKRHARFGTLWAERFRSVIVEEMSETIQIVAAYIDLNPVRAGLVKDPKDYRFCGYAEALAGGRESRGGIMSFHPAGTWHRVSSCYRQFLFVKGGLSGHSQKVSMDRETILKELKHGARLSLAQLLRLKIRYFSDGVALGSMNYLNELYLEYRDRFGRQRKSGARSLNSALIAFPLMSLRDLKREPFK